MAACNLTVDRPRVVFGRRHYTPQRQRELENRFDKEKFPQDRWVVTDEFARLFLHRRFAEDEVQFAGRS
jgi:hypothetical protein